MKNLGIISLIVGIIILVIAVVSKFTGPLLGSLPSAIMNFSANLFLLSIALILLEKK